GYAEVGSDKVTILAETAELSKDIDVERANRALANAQETLKGLSPDDKKYSDTESAIERATVRLETAKK
ncbi:MAG: F0F1 ATP synthase subunit epsilon, partial [Proteobacteria bacterium]|nr:F0F1 ATP synthase subunit epsilon [Pseudomonadota bacterium]